MEKLTLYGIGAEGGYTFMIVEKHPNILHWLADFMEETFGIHREAVELQEEDPEHGLVDRTADELVDLHDTFHGDQVRIDVFYGASRVFVTILCGPDARGVVLKEIEMRTVFAEPGV